MEHSQESATLNREQYERALQLLDDERDALRLSRWQRVAYVFLNIAVFGWLLFFVAFVMLGILAPDQGTHPLSVAAIFCLGISTLLGLLSPLALLMNLPLILKILAQGRLVQKLGLKEVFASEMQQRSRLAPALGVLSILLSASGLLLVSFGIGVLFIEPSTIDNTQFRGLFSLFLIAAGFSIFSIYFIRRGRRKLKVAAEIGRLSRTLRSFESDGDEISIPGQYLNEIENVERQQIARDRSQTVLKSAAESVESPYFMQKSRAARKAVDTLPMETQLLLDDAISGLTKNPHPSDAEATEADQYVWYPEGGQVRVTYRLDEAAKKIQLLDVEARVADPVGNGQEST